MYSFPDLEPVCGLMSSSNCCFLTCIQVSQKVGKMVWFPSLEEIFLSVLFFSSCFTLYLFIFIVVKYAVLCLVTQSCPTLCYPMDCSLPSSSVHGILQARILEWVAFPFSRGSFQPRDQTQVSHIADEFFTN